MKVTVLTFNICMEIYIFFKWLTNNSNQKAHDEQAGWRLHIYDYPNLNFHWKNDTESLHY